MHHTILKSGTSLLAKKLTNLLMVLLFKDFGPLRKPLILLSETLGIGLSPIAVLDITWPQRYF